MTCASLGSCQIGLVGTTCSLCPTTSIRIVRKPRVLWQWRGLGQTLVESVESYSDFLPSMREQKMCSRTNNVCMCIYIYICYIYIYVVFFLGHLRLAGNLIDLPISTPPKISLKNKDAMRLLSYRRAMSCMSRSSIVQPRILGADGKNGGFNQSGVVVVVVGWLVG